MKKLRILTGVLVAAIICFGGMALSAQQTDQKDRIQVKDEAGFAQMAKISINSAINAALKQFPGKVLQAELKNENNYLVYDVEIVNADHKIENVKVDAGNGSILKIDRERQDTEGREGENNDNKHESEE